ncbi:hypothetical protein [Burkholderia ambifaria]|uniref:hypothetical protein n=1 Tax=Burkholderia ambifaria TaxID=152480 RepID=UPI0039E55B6D
MKQSEAPAPRRKISSAFPLDHVLSIGVDKLKLALMVKHLGDAQMSFIDQQLRDLEGIQAKRKSVKGRAFRNSLVVNVAGGVLRIEWSPNRAVYPYWLTVEFNPNTYLRAGAGAVHELASFFRLLFGVDATRIMSRALVLRMDINIDFDINVLEGTLVSMKEKRGGANVMRDFDGKGTLATLYVGVLGSDCRLTIYDKAAETLRRELRTTASVTLAALASPNGWQLAIRKLKAKEKAIDNHWRMEVRCQRKGGYLLSDVTELASSFDGVRLFHLPPDRAPFNDSLGRTFIGLARHVGIEVALQALDTNDRRRIQRAVSKLDQVEWFNAEILRDHIKEAIARLNPMVRPGAGQLVTMRPLPIKRPSSPARQQAATAVPSRAANMAMKSADQPVRKRVVPVKCGPVKRGAADSWERKPSRGRIG